MSVRFRVATLAGLLGSVLTSAPLLGQDRVYVTNQDDATVSILDAKSRRLLETLDLRRYGFGDNAKPHHAQVEPDGKAWYVTLIGAGKVLKLDRSNKLLGSADLEVPGLMTLQPGGDLLFIGRSMSAVNPPPRMAIVRRSDMRLLDEVDLLFPRPHGIVTHPKGKRVYVASLGTNQIASVGVDEQDVELIDVPGPAHGFVQAAVSPDGRWLAVTAELTDQLLIFDLRDSRKPRLSRTIALPDGPFEPTFTGDGRWVFVTCLTANRVAVVDAGTWKVAGVLEHAAFAQPHGVALSPDGQHVFVSNRHQLGGTHQHAGGKPTGTGTVVAFCAATRKPEQTVAVGHYAAGIGSALPLGKAVPAPRPCH
jgi:DNA-binding beta-propeller fold protein YncE